MRQYKFRGKRIVDGQWVYGSLIVWPDGEAEIAAFDSETSANKYSVWPETVGMFTNRLDNDLMSDIYQGDILQSANGKMWEVVFKNYGWAISNRRIKDNGRNKFGGIEEYSFEEYINLCKKAKVEPFKKIGNIHDHPALLNAAPATEGINHMTTDPREQAEQPEVQQPEVLPDSEEGATQG